MSYYVFFFDDVNYSPESAWRALSIAPTMSVARSNAARYWTSSPCEFVPHEHPGVFSVVIVERVMSRDASGYMNRHRVLGVVCIVPMPSAARSTPIAMPELPATSPDLEF
jgi:hypothetical protein